jgi:hypothetical protein
MEQKHPLPPFTLETAKRKFNWQKMPGTVRILKEFPKHIPSTVSGETGILL